MAANETVDLVELAKKKNLEAFLKKMIYWFISIAAVAGLASWLVMVVPSEAH